MTRSPAPRHRRYWMTSRPFSIFGWNDCFACGCQIWFSARLGASGRDYNARVRCPICGVTQMFHQLVEAD